MQILAREVSELMRKVAVVASMTVASQCKLAQLVFLLRLTTWFGLEVLLSLMLAALFLCETSIAFLLLELSLAWGLLVSEFGSLLELALGLFRRLLSTRLCLLRITLRFLHQSCLINYSQDILDI